MLDFSLSIILIFAAVVAILLLARYLYDKMNNNTNRPATPTNPPTDTKPIPPLPMAEPPYEYWMILNLLRECIDANHLSMGLCRPYPHPAQHSAPPGYWVKMGKNGVLLYWFVFDALPQSPNTSSAPKPINVATLLNQLLPAYCFAEGMPLFRVVAVRPMKNGRIAIGVVRE